MASYTDTGVAELYGLLPTETPSGAQRERLACFPQIFAIGIKPSLWKKSLRVVKIPRIVRYRPGTGIHFRLPPK